MIEIISDIPCNQEGNSNVNEPNLKVKDHIFEPVS